MKNPAITIIGTGALGSVLAEAFDTEGFPIKSLYNRSQQRLDELQSTIHASHSGTFPSDKSVLGKVIFLTVPDKNIRDMANKLAGLADDFSGSIVIHCSGTKSSRELKALQDKGAAVASFHPLQTFSASSGPADLKNIYFDTEGDAEALQFLNGLAGWWKSEVLEITPEAKPFLHASAVVASNYLVALLGLASDIAAMGNLEKSTARKAIIPLVQQTLTNCSGSDPLPRVLSGPIARGDISTVEEHLELLKQDQHISHLYKMLGQETIKLAEAGSKVNRADLQALKNLLEQQDE